MKHCRNCDTPLEGPFCPQCGQRDVDLDRPLQALLGEAIREAFDLDGRAMRTLRTLFRRPGVLTNEYLAGHRRRYSSPIRLYLVVSVLFFVVAAWVVGRGMLLGEGQSLEADAPGQARFVSEDLPRLMFVLLPVFALLLKAVFWRRLYFEHLIHSLHIHSAAYLILVFLLPLEDAANRLVWALILQLGLAVYLVAYLLISVRRVYVASWTATVGKTAGVLLAYMVLVAGLSEALSFLTMPDSSALPFLTD
ncbi:MAG: DUF3667 domain-containing protein [Gammaproteobacteria bacterium]|jgi:hypothetical protein